MIVNLIVKILTLYIFYIYIYNSIISVFGVFSKEEKIQHVPYKTNFLILIPCHNEEDVIYNTIKSIFSSHYSKKLFNIVPILDNCTDKTYDEVQRFIKDHPNHNCNPIIVNGGSKPKAINAATRYLKNSNDWNNYNSIMVIDADNILSENTLCSFDYFHQLGEKILQCRILSHNDDSMIARGFTSSFNLMTHSFQMARTNLGLSASLCGTGFSIDREVWDSIDFRHCTTLTEDLEFSILFILNGYKIKFINTVHVLNQNLDEFKPSITQRIRWCRGHMQVFIKYTPKILLHFIKKPSFQLLDSFLFLSTPSRTSLYLITNILILFTRTTYIPMSIILLFLVYNLLYSFYCNKFKIRYLLPHIFYSLCMQFIIIVGALTFKKTHWVKTKHKKIKPD